MENKSVIKIGICVTAASALLIWGLSFLKGSTLMGSDITYVAEYPRLNGLDEGCPVMLSGYKIGTVESITFRDNGSDMRIFASLKIGKDFRLPKGTMAKIVSTDIMGTKGVEIIRPTGASEYLSSGDTLAASFEGGLTDQIAAMIGPVQEHLGSLLSGADSAVCSINALMSEQNMQALGGALDGLSQISAALSANSGNISAMMQSLGSASEALGSNAGNISRAIGNLAQISDTLSAINIGQTIRDAQQAINEINKAMLAINSGSGTAAQILRNDTLYRNLEAASQKINCLLCDFEKHPKKYVSLSIFGGKEKEKSKK